MHINTDEIASIDTSCDGNTSLPLTIEPDAFWKKYLAGFSAPTPLLHLPLESASSTISEPTAKIVGAISSELVGDLTAKAAPMGLTLSTIIQAAWGLLLHRNSREEDIIFGITTNDPQGTSSAVGVKERLALHQVPLRTQVTLEDPLCDWLRQLQKDKEHMSYARASVSEIHSWSDITEKKPLYESLVRFDESAQQALSYDEQAQRETESDKTVPYAILVHAFLEKDLIIQLQYAIDRFDEASMERMLGHLITLLEAMPLALDKTIGSLPLLTAHEREEIVVAWNQNDASYPQEMTIQELIEEQVSKSPGHCAVCQEEARLSYEELNAKANQVAHFLRTQGVGPDVLVGLSLERRPEMVIGLLGILKAGGAYVPLDPSYPEDRLEYMIHDAGLKIILSQEKLEPILPSGKAKVFCLDTQWELFEQASTDNPIKQTTPDNLAYVIYTSGSTGKPKGVLITHQGVINHGVSSAREFALVPEDRVLQFSSISFDISVEEIFPTFFSGATLVLRTDEMLASSSIFMKKIEQLKLNVLNLPTAYFSEWVRGWSKNKEVLPASLRLVIIGGEKVPAPLFLKWLEGTQHQVRTLNSYGPTETTVTATIYEVTTPVGSFDEEVEIPIGRPIQNVLTYILDEKQEPVPIGMPGELFIGGDSVAKGYLHRDDLTKERFILNPFLDGSSKLYRTGDLVRYLPDSNIDFLGRIDHQVKLRGFRIELGEIELTIESHKGVDQAIVMVREDEPGHKRLVAYLVAQLATDSSPLDNPLDNANSEGRREHFRVTLQEPCTLSLENNTNFQAVIKDLSYSGVGLTALSPNALSIGEQIVLSVAVPGTSSTNQWKGRVRWQYGANAGIEFEEEVRALEQTKDQIKYLIEHADPIIYDRRRSAFRVDMDLPCRVLWRDELLDLRSKNISSTGIFLLGVPETCTTHDRVQLSFRLPETSEDIEIPGEVVWSEAGEAGIRFEDVQCVRERLGTQLNQYLHQEGLTLEHLRENMREKLPEYMIPSVFVMLDKMPLTPNGKIDRRSLPVPDSQGSSQPYVAPHDEVEEKMVAIWEELLQVNPVSIQDDFYELGGHSLLAVRLFTELDAAFGKNLPLATLLEASTVEALSRAVQNFDADEEWSSLVNIKKEGTKSPIYFIHSLGGDVLIYKELFDLLDRPIYGLRMQGLDGQQDPSTSIEECATAYLSEIKKVQEKGPYSIAGFSSGGVVAYEMARRLSDEGDKIAHLILLDSTLPEAIYGQTKWKLGQILGFFNNLPYFLIEQARRGPNRILDRVLRKYKSRIPTKECKPSKEKKEVDPLLEQLKKDLKVDLSHLPEYRLNAIKQHYHAFVKFRPSVYSGKATLFRIRKQSIRGPHDKAFGWDSFLEGGVDVHYVSGTHSTMFKSPHVETLHKKLYDVLE